MFGLGNDETSAQEESEGTEQDEVEKEPKLTEDDDDWMFRQELDFADEQFINVSCYLLTYLGTFHPRSLNSRGFLC